VAGWLHRGDFVAGRRERERGRGRETESKSGDRGSDIRKLINA
jgi:hypothetical protein